jgi:hypothetical protein
VSTMRAKKLWTVLDQDSTPLEYLCDGRYQIEGFETRNAALRAYRKECDDPPRADQVVRIFIIW